MRMRHLFAACALSLSALAPAGAEPLAPYTVFGQAFLNVGGTGVTLTDFGTQSLSLVNVGSVTMSAAGTPSPLLQADADVAGTALFGRAVVSLSYVFAVVGPQAFVPVTVDVHGAASATASSGASFVVQSRWSMFFDEFNPVAGDAIQTPQTFGTSFSQAFDRHLELTLIANLPYTITMVVDAEAAATPAGSQAHATAMVDPLFTLGDGADPQLYSLQFSSGIGNVAAVPEPPPLALWLLGAAALLGWCRRVGRREG